MASGGKQITGTDAALGKKGLSGIFDFKAQGKEGVFDGNLFSQDPSTSYARESALLAEAKKKNKSVAHRNDTDTDEQEQEEENKKKDSKALTLFERNLQAVQQILDNYMRRAAWYKMREKKSEENITRIGEQMRRNSDFINDAQDFIARTDKSGKFNKEDALRIFRERGLQVDEKLSDQQLFDLLKRKSAELEESNKKWAARLDEQKDFSNYNRGQASTNDNVAKEFAPKKDAANPPGQSQEQSAPQLGSLVDGHKAADAKAAAKQAEDRAKQEQKDRELESGLFADDAINPNAAYSEEAPETESVVGSDQNVINPASGSNQPALPKEAPAAGLIPPSIIGR